MASVFDGWAIVELMGHRRLAGKVTTTEVLGANFLRLDVPHNPPQHAQDSASEIFAATQFYSPSAIYCLTPTTEDTARRVAAIVKVAPVSTWELPQLQVKSDTTNAAVASQATQTHVDQHDDDIDF